MTAFVGLLRAVNVGGSGKLPMGALRDMCRALGFEDVRTYIASGNVVFSSNAAESEVKSGLEARLAAHAERRVDVMVRTGADLAAILAANPFIEAPASRAVVIFLDEPPPEGLLDAVAGRTVEEIALGRREIYVHYAAGQAASRLRFPARLTGTARNMNTVARLAEMARAVGSGSPG